jgi:hypothetical protein
MCEILDCTTFTALTIEQVWERFRESADDAEQPRDLALHILDEAIRGDACAQELIETCCNVTFR